MGLVPRKFGNVRILPLTRTIADAIHASSATALSGDGSCSLYNMQSSCFAAESCNHGTMPRVTIYSLMRMKYAFVAVDGSNAFVGCVGVDHANTKYFSECSKGLILYNLCVSPEFQGAGIGRMLVEHIIQMGFPVFLYVARSQREEMRHVFRDRVDRLFKTYDRLDFKKVNECQEFYLFHYCK